MNAEYAQGQIFRANDQFRMCKLQVFNWGTFDQLHTVPVSEKGFLFVGRSGSGKTTLLDAIATLLVPGKWLHFNAAAQEADGRGRDRNLVTYIRGAWAAQKDGGSGEVATRYLRVGTTWSAIALTFRHTDGRVVCLVQLFWIRGNANGNADVRRHFMVLERPFDITELNDFDLDLKKLKRDLDGAYHFNQFSGYCGRFMRLLDIDNELTLRLLHKTQSAKNLGDLNTFLRAFMLEEPPTFQAADTLVSEFGELNEAHQAVVTARKQVETLRPARTAYERLEAALEERASLDALRQAMDAYREVRLMGLLEARLAALRTRREGLTASIHAREEALTGHRSTLQQLEEEHRQQGGGRIEQLELEKATLSRRHQERLNKRSQAQQACTGLGWGMATTPQAFAELTGEARRALDDWQQNAPRIREQMFTIHEQKNEVQKDLAASVKELEALRRQPSNIPARMLEMRDAVLHALGLPEGALPFAGELMEVKKEEAAWRGAVERVLRGFALSLLVDEKHYAALSTYVNYHHLNGRLVYFKTRAETVTDTVADLSSLVRKITLKESPYRAWLDAELHQHFNYQCVESLRAFRQAERALTPAGQVRHNIKRHEKDDRYDVNDQRHWVLGFDNQDKRALYETQVRELQERLDRLQAELERLKTSEQQDRDRSMFCQTLANLQWQEVDVASAADRLAEVEQQIAAVREGNKELQEIAKRLTAERDAIRRLEKAQEDDKLEERACRKEWETSNHKLAALRDAARDRVLSDEQRGELDQRLDALKQPLTLENLDRQTQLAERDLSREINLLDAECNRLEKAVERCFAEFKRSWPLEASDVDATINSANDFLAKLARLELDGLPAYEKRFFELLQTQSHQNLAALNTIVQQAHREIRDRMELVNESLAEAEFNPGTCLRIDVSDRQNAEVRAFKQELKQALSNAFVEDREIAEQRYLLLRRLVERLGSQEGDAKRWRETVLDVRTHVEFIGRELDREGHEIEVYRSGAGKSGGQRQKLATTCLAAALRYQLGGSDRETPVYAPVVLDEAFDKADNEFTALAMKIFQKFGFQMIVATPLKSVMTLEPFIGGACFIDIGDRQRSSVLLIEYDEARQRLDLPEHEQ